MTHFLLLVLGCATAFTRAGQSAVTSAAAADYDAVISIDITEDLVERNRSVSGIAQISGGSGGAVELKVELQDQMGRVVDRVDIKSAVQADAQAFEIPFSLDTTWFLTMVGKVHAAGRFSSGGSRSLSPPVHAKPINVSVIPYPLDYDDYWTNVWGGGSADSPDYFAALQEASVGLGHLYRDYDYDGKPLDDGTSYGSYHGALHNFRPNHDFLEDKLWFEMAETHPLPETLKQIYGKL